MTRSDVVFKSLPVASDKRSIGIRPLIESLTDQPARDIYPKASADSAAVFVVALPAFLAAASILS